MGEKERNEVIDDLLVQVSTLVERLSDYPDLKKDVTELKSLRDKMWGLLLGAGVGGGTFGALIQKMMAALH